LTQDADLFAKSSSYFLRKKNKFSSNKENFELKNIENQYEKDLQDITYNAYIKEINKPQENIKRINILANIQNIEYEKVRLLQENIALKKLIKSKIPQETATVSVSE
jgi:hypothetical protein